jgi:hypothetical protein
MSFSCVGERKSHVWDVNGHCECGALQCTEQIFVDGGMRRCLNEITGGQGMIGPIDATKCTLHCWL